MTNTSSVVEATPLEIPVSGEKSMPQISPEVLAAKFEAHMASCDERAKRDHSDMQQLAVSVDNLGGKVESGLARVHKRIDESEKSDSKVKTAAVAFMFTLLFAMIGYLIANGTPWAKF